VDQGEQTPAVYRAFRAVGAPFRFRVEGLRYVGPHGPAIFAANHLNSLGPIQAILSIPVRFYPWIIGEMLDPVRAPRYLYDDFVSRDLHLEGGTGMAVATAISWISVRLLRAAGAISIDNNRGRILDGFRRSLELLAEGHNLLIFPEDTREPADPETGMHPFKPGFAQLCTMHQRTAGQELPVYPMAVHAGARCIAIDRPMFVRDGGGRREELELARATLRERMVELYRELENRSKPV
jgi:1-acyl-sn-glycerol-3-phosphate acyltransferase